MVNSIAGGREENFGLTPFILESSFYNAEVNRPWRCGRVYLQTQKKKKRVDRVTDQNHKGRIAFLWHFLG